MKYPKSPYKYKKKKGKQKERKIQKQTTHK